MKISLSKKGPAFWFLGDPKNLQVCLSQSNPGPIDIDITKLTNLERLRLLRSLQLKELETDKIDNNLYNLNTQQANNQDQLIQEQRHLSRLKKIEDDKQKKEHDEYIISERLRLIAKSSSNTVMYFVKKEKDIDLLKKLLNHERVNKNRNGIIKYINERIILLSTEKERLLASQIQKEMYSQLKTLEKETSEFNMIESEQEIVFLTSKDLIDAVTGGA